MGVIINILIGLILCWIFTGVGSLISLQFRDRMKGFGFSLSLWLFLVLIYDGLILTLLLVLKDYPLDMISGIIGVLNPIGLSRVLLLVYHDGSLLLGYTGVLVQNLILSFNGILIAISILILWLVIPVLLGIKKITNRDF